MPQMHIKTTIMYAPVVHNISFIIRGATAQFKIDLTYKLYDFNEIAQLHYLFKQSNKIYDFSLKKYYKYTDDTIVSIDNMYYARTASSSSLSGYVFNVLDLEPGSTILPNTVFEAYTLPENETSENWQLNNKFSYYKSDTEEYIKLTLSSSDTLAFSETSPRLNMKCETATQIAIISEDETATVISTIVESQNEIVVIGSIYGMIHYGYSDHPVVSNDLYCSNELVCNN